MNRTQSMSRIRRDHRVESSSKISVSLPICEDPATLVRASLAGDREAFAHIVRQYQGIVCGFACGTLGDPWGSEDIAQETFCIAWKQLEMLQNPNQLSSWLCGIARNLTRHALRKRRLSDAKNVFLRHDLPPSLPLSLTETRQRTYESTTSKSMSQLASDVEEPFTTLWREERNRLLWDTVATIPSIYRIPLVMYYRGERSTAEIATALEISTDAVAQRISRARKLLRTELLRQMEDVLESSGPDEYFTLSVIAMLSTVEKCRVAMALATGTTTIGSLGITSSTTGSTMKGSWMMYCFSTFFIPFRDWVLGTRCASWNRSSHPQRSNTRIATASAANQFATIYAFGDFAVRLRLLCVPGQYLFRRLSATTVWLNMVSFSSTLDRVSYYATRQFLWDTLSPATRRGSISGTFRVRFHTGRFAT